MKRYLYLSLISILSFIFSENFFSQTMPACPNGQVYLHNCPIQVYTPSLPLSASNPSNTAIPCGGTGLTFGPNLNAAFPSPTFYTTIGGNMAWWNGAAWVNTGFSMPAVNLGGGGGVIYGLIGGTGQIYVYNGTGPATLLMTIGTFAGGGPYDVVADNCGNFYILKTTTPQSMTCYGPGGAVLCTYNMTGMPSISAGGGFAIVNGQVIVSNTGGLFIGNMSGSTVSFTNVSATAGGAGDYAQCPMSCGPVNATAANSTTSTPLGCAAGIATVVATTTAAPVTYQWAGPGIVSGSTASLATVNTPGVYSCTITSAGCPPSTTVVTTNVVGSATFTPTATVVGTITCTTPTVQITAMPGPLNYTYTWTGPGIVGANNSQIITANMPGVYTATVGNTLTGCKGTVAVTVVQNLVPPVLTVVPTTTTICIGSSANISVSGATTYTWSPAVGLNTTNGPAVIASPVLTTTYTVVGSIGTCTAMATSVVSISPQPSAIITQTNATCGSNNGVVVISNTSGGGQTIVGYTFDGAGIATQTVINVASGSHTITMTNSIGCKTTYVINITNTPPITALGTVPTNPTCGNNNGSIALGLVTGGTPTYSYSVNGGPFTTAPTLTGLAPGTYTITVKDIFGCTFTKNVTLVNQQGPTAILFTTGLTACSANTGVLTITGVTGGTAGYTFTVDATPTGSVTNNLAAGTHTVIVKDVNGCIYNTTFVINTVLGPSAAVVAPSNAACGNANGSATVTSVTGGLAPYQYSFNGGPFSSTNLTSGLLAGPHSVVIKDNNGCTYTVNFVVGNTGSPVSSIGTLSNVACFGGSSGSFTINTGGGTPGYSYTITPTNVTSGTGIFTNLTAQNYTINVKDAAGCVTTVTTTITQPTALTLTLSSLPPSCNAGANGTVTAIASNGTGPYQFSLNGGGFQVGTSFTGVGAGIYNVTVKDANGCTLTQSVQVTQPSAITLTFTSTNSNCTSANGTTSVTANGGTPAYSYTWSGAGGNASQSNPLVAGSYTVTVKDANGCTTTGVGIINATPGGTAVITATTNVTCNGLANGSLTSGVTGAMVAPLSYSWSNGQITQTATNLAPGTYTVKITDAFGCTASVAGTITEPAILAFGLTSTSVTCFGGNNGTGIVGNLSGGTAPYSYLWTAGGATTSVANNLPAGTYTCTVTDANSCSTTNTVIVTQATSVTLTASVTTANCNQSNGSATVSATGGAPAYTYTWSTSTVGPVLTGVAAGTYSILLKDANSCTYTVAATIPNASGPTIAIASSTNVSCFGGNNGVATATAAAGVPPYTFLWSNAQNTGSATNLLNGVYTVTVTDQMGCKASTSVTITQPPLLVVNATGTNPLCFGSANGTANAGVLGGTAGYTYTWTPSGGNAASASGLIAGNYLVTVTDANGCVATSTVGLVNPAQMTAAITSTNVTCNGACNGMANGTTANSVGFVSYFWTGGPGPLSTQNVANLCNGTYTLLATDINNCTASAIVTITQPTALTASITSSGNPSCATYTNGFATVTAGGGTPAYTYSWSGSASTLATASGLGAGTYSVTVTDTKGCNVTTQVIITQPAALQSTLTSANITCNGLNNGTANVAYSGGTGPYTFLWLPTLNNTSTVNNLPPGTHTIQITDNLGCVTTKTTVITQPAPLVATITSTNSNCTQANGNACVSVTGGTGTLTYLWSSNPTFTNSCIPNVVAGAYTITVTDANNCTVSGIAIINDIAGPNVVITATTAVSCFGGSNGSAITSITGGVAPVTVLWSYLAQTTPNVNNLPAGLHSITVKDAANCVSSASVMITQPTQLVSAITNVTQITCNGASNGTATMLLNGGTPAYSYTWTNGGPVQSSSVAVSMGPGTWTCSVTDNNGCPTSQQVVISQPNPLVINSFTVTNILCSGANTGQIATNITGGTPVYTLVWTPTQPANAVITNLAAGSYSLLVTDTKSCTTSGTYNITQPSAITSAATATPATCGNANGSATVTVNGGTPGYTYNWNTTTPQLTPIATGMSSATWMCTITDVNGCIHTQTVAVPNAPGPVITAMTFTAPLCFGQLNGSMALTYSSGTAPYTYLWNNPGASTSQNVSGVGVGVYSATVTDVYGCTTSSVVNVTQPNQLILNVSPNTTICYGQLYQIYGAAGGGTQPYNYTWNPSTFVGAGPHVVTPTLTTQYTVSVVDNNGCPTLPKIITVNVSPQLTATGFSLTRCDKMTAILTPNISSTNVGNGGPYSYNWSNGATSSNVLVTANYISNPNTYTVNISDGCTLPGAQAVFTVNVNPLPSGTFSSDVQKGCQPLAVVFTANSSSATDTYAWSFGDNNYNGTGNPVNAYYNNFGVYSISLLITNSFGCVKDTTINNYIEVYPNPIAEFVATPWSSTILEPGVHFTNQSIGANSYFWDFGDYSSSSNNSTAVNPDHDFNFAGVYPVYLVAISDKGCTDTVMHNIEITPDYGIYIPNAFTPDGNNKNDIFQPKGYGIDDTSYRMDIFDRWGEIIFTSDNFYKGWDGTVKGDKGVAEQGVYVYQIKVKDLEGNIHTYTGHVTCLPRESKIK